MVMDLRTPQPTAATLTAARRCCRSVLAVWLHVSAATGGTEEGMDGRHTQVTRGRKRVREGAAVAARVGGAARARGRDRRSDRGDRRHLGRRLPPALRAAALLPLPPLPPRRASAPAVAPPPPPYDVMASRVGAILDRMAAHDETLRRQGAILEALNASLGVRVDSGRAVGSSASAGSAAGPSGASPDSASGSASQSPRPLPACSCCNHCFFFSPPLCLCASAVFFSFVRASH